MPARPRLYLFYGNDNYASHAALLQWQRLFIQKYSASTCYVINADDVGQAESLSLVEQYLEGDTLFAEPKLIILKRYLQVERGNSAAQKLIALLERKQPCLTDMVTLAIWEEQNLKPEHAVLKFLNQLQGLAQVRCFSVPSPTQLTGVAQKYVQKYGLTLQPEAVKWLRDQYVLYEKIIRLQQRLRTGDVAVKDERSWWLFSLLEQVALYAQTAEITLEDVQRVGATMGAAVGAFDIVQAIVDGKWKQARHLLKGFSDNGADASDYFGLLAALQWKISRSQISHAFALQQWCVEIEIIAKNYPVSLEWLFEIMLNRLELSQTTSLIAPKILWLARLP